MARESERAQATFSNVNSVLVTPSISDIDDQMSQKNLHRRVVAAKLFLEVLNHQLKENYSTFPKKIIQMNVKRLIRAKIYSTKRKRYETFQKIYNRNTGSFL